MIMYKNSMALAIKHNGKILREIQDLVYLPFGSEYSILIKNLNTRRAQVQVSIDGTDIGDGTKFIINANSDLEIKRFVRNGNMDEGNAFKFIERTGAIEDHRGIKMEDGIIRIEFQFEKEVIHHEAIHVYHERWPYYWPRRYYDPYWDYYYNNTYGGSLLTSNSISTTGVAQNAVPTPLQNSALRGTTANAATKSLNSTNSGESTALDSTFNTQATGQNSSFSAPLNDIGITVPGSKVEQKFTTVYGFNAETDSHVLILRLAGETAENKPVEKAVTVKTKSKCEICGKTNKATASFCSNCGTAVQLI